MKDLSGRVPSIAKKIFNFLDKQSLVKCKGIDKNIKRFLDNERFFFLRIINNYKGNFVEFEESWKKILHKSQLGFVKELAFVTQQFFLRRSKRLEEQWHPLLIAAESGNLELCRKIFENSRAKCFRGIIEIVLVATIFNIINYHRNIAGGYSNNGGRGWALVFPGRLPGKINLF